MRFRPRSAVGRPGNELRTGTHARGPREGKVKIGRGIPKMQDGGGGPPHNHLRDGVPSADSLGLVPGVEQKHLNAPTVGRVDNPRPNGPNVRRSGSGRGDYTNVAVKGRCDHPASGNV